MGREHWVETTLGEIAKWQSGGTPTATNPDYYHGDIPWLIIGDLNDGEIFDSAKKITSSGLENSSAKWVPLESVLIAMYGSIGKLGINKIECTTNQAIAFTQSIYGGIPQEFIFNFLKYSRENLLGLGKGGAQSNISLTVLNAYSFPLPPVNEQKRIVEKLDSILPKVKNAKARLEKIPLILKKFRQSVRTAACSGRLTEEWRIDNAIVYKSNVLRDRLESINNIDVVECFANDDGWLVVKAKYVTSRITKGTTPKADDIHSIGSFPYLKVYNIVGQKIDFHYKPQYVNEKTHKGLLQRSIIYPGDILMNIVGPPLGKVAITPNSYAEWNINQAIAFFRPIQDVISSEYLYIVLCDGEPIQEISKEFRGSAGQQNISLEQARNFEIPLPSLVEQQEIVRRVEKLFALADSLESKYKKAIQRVEKIEQYVLAKAFRGELTDPDPTDEPATELLKRILEEKTKLESTKKPRSKSAGKTAIVVA